ncbi:MAG: hypothetical protein U0822_02440 [Anaerolineae bacterium]
MRDAQVVDASGLYEIVIQGNLDKGQVGRLGDMRILAPDPRRKLGITVLLGHLPCQTALIEVLDALYDGRYVLLSLNRLADRTVSNAATVQYYLRR